MRFIPTREYTVSAEAKRRSLLEGMACVERSIGLKGKLHFSQPVWCSAKYLMKRKQPPQPTSLFPALPAPLLGAFFALFASRCGRGQPSELRLTLNPWPGSEFLYLAKEKGFLAAEKVNVRRVKYSSLSDTSKSLRT